MGVAGAGGDQQGVFTLRDKAGDGELEDESAVDSLC